MIYFENLGWAKFLAHSDFIKKISLSDFAKNSLCVSTRSFYNLLKIKNIQELNECELKHFNTIKSWIEILDNKLPNSESLGINDPMVPNKTQICDKK